MPERSKELKKIFINLFKGRQDVYAVRWEKEYVPLTIDAFERHWNGQEMIGIYPLLEDNTSYFIAADFDKSNWQEQVRMFSKVCEEFNLSHYIERSRSGNGAHVWIFFEEKYPANKSRSIVFELLRKAKVISEFDKDGSFDRLFPNQDFHKGLGLGNLIALPMNGKCITSGNTCFLNAETLDTIDDQWSFLKTIRKNPTSKLDELFESFFGAIKSVGTDEEAKHSFELKIIIKNQIYLKRSQLSQKIKLFIREHLNFINADYIIRKKMGRSTHKTEMFFKLIEETEKKVLLPKGFANELINFCKKENIGFKLEDNRTKHDDISFSAEIDLYNYQKKVIDDISGKDFGVIVAPPGTGKTIISLSLIAQRKQPALIIVHRKQLFDQWIERIQTFLKFQNIR